MLVLSRKFGERIHIGDGITISIVAIHGNRVQLGIDAPPEVRIVRDEVARPVEIPAPVSVLGGLPR